MNQENVVGMSGNLPQGKGTGKNGGYGTGWTQSGEMVGRSWWEFSSLTDGGRREGDAGVQRIPSERDGGGIGGFGRNWQIFGSRAKVECWEMVEGVIAELGGR